MTTSHNTRIKWRRDTSAKWEQNNPVLLYGEIVIVDTAAGEIRFKVGDGSKTYTQLPFTDEAVRNLLLTKIEEVSALPDVTTADNAKTLVVQDGEWVVAPPASTACTILRYNEGAE